MGALVFGTCSKGTMPIWMDYASTMLFFRLLNEFLLWCLPISFSNWCQHYFCLFVQSLQLLSVSLGTVLGLLCAVTVLYQGTAEVSFGLLLWSTLLLSSLVHFLDPFCAVTVCASEFLSWSYMGSCSLCFRVPLRSQEDRRAWGHSGTCVSKIFKDLHPWKVTF